MEPNDENPLVSIIILNYNAGKLIEIFADYCPQDMNIYGLYPYTKHIQPKLRVYIDFLVKALQV